jgi:protein gp37
VGANTGIQWADHTWNPWQGCHKVSAGCANCYMEREKLRYGQDPFTVKRSARATFNQPITAGYAPGSRIFVCSWSDFFIEEADGDLRHDAWDIIRQSRQLIFMILTKRIERAAQCLPPDWGEGWPNVWGGVTVESQEYDWRIRELLALPFAVRFVSVEPMLGQINLRGGSYGPDWLEGWDVRAEHDPRCDGSCSRGLCPVPVQYQTPKIDGVICGCESGDKEHLSRPMDRFWALDLLGQCQAAGVPFFYKQGPDDNGMVCKMPVLLGRVWDQLPKGVMSHAASPG